MQQRLSAVDERIMNRKMNHLKDSSQREKTMKMDEESLWDLENTIKKPQNTNVCVMRVSEEREEGRMLI